MSGRDKALLLEAGLKDNDICDVENRRNSGRDVSHNLATPAYLSNASDYFLAVSKDGLADLQQKLQLSDRTSAGVSHG